MGVGCPKREGRCHERRIHAKIFKKSGILFGKSEILFVGPTRVVG